MCHMSEPFGPLWLLSFIFPPSMQAMIRAFPFCFPAVVLIFNADFPKVKDEGVVRYCCAVSRCAPMTLCICCESCWMTMLANKNFNDENKGPPHPLVTLWRSKDGAFSPRAKVVPS